MAGMVRNLPRLVAQSTGTGSVTQGIGSLDDASSITIFPQSTAGFAVGALIVQISQFDPAIPTPLGVTESTGWQAVSTGAAFVFTSSNTALTLSNISFKGLRLSGTSSSATSEVVAYVSKQISV